MGLMPGMPIGPDGRYQMPARQEGFSPYALSRMAGIDQYLASAPPPGISGGPFPKFNYAASPGTGGGGGDGGTGGGGTGGGVGDNVHPGGDLGNVGGGVGGDYGGSIGSPYSGSYDGFGFGDLSFGDFSLGRTNWSDLSDYALAGIGGLATGGPIGGLLGLGGLAIKDIYNGLSSPSGEPANAGIPDYGWADVGYGTQGGYGGYDGGGGMGGGFGGNDGFAAGGYGGLY